CARGETASVYYGLDSS
nr:immunoglobulin heavy chain junction region [Macaca mulatta]